MKKFVVLWIIPLLLLLSMLLAFGCQVQYIEWEKHFKNGSALVLDGKYEEAILELDKTIEIKAEFADAYYTRGLAYEKIGEVDKAVNDYEKCIKLSKDSELLATAKMRLDKLK